jgi:hypothetical protein
MSERDPDVQAQDYRPGRRRGGAGAGGDGDGNRFAERAMTLDEARDHIGEGVIYRAGSVVAEDGVITSVNDHYVFVRYRVLGDGVATAPGDLTLLAWLASVAPRPAPPKP